MTAVWTLAVLVLGAQAAADRETAAPDTLPVDLNSCTLCHSMPELFGGENHRCYVPADRLANDVHYSKGLRCHDCHGGNPTTLDKEQAHSREVSNPELGIRPFRFPLSEMSGACARCHEQQYDGVTHGVHAVAAKGVDGAKGPLGCGACHGQETHHIRSVADPQSPVFAENQVTLCGGCHAKQKGEYDVSVHGRALYDAGLSVVAVCSDCHGAHAIRRATDEESLLHPSHVADTCGRCHRFIEERLKQSVHGSGEGPGEPADRAAPGGDTKRKPSCTDCHYGHDLPDPKSSAFRLRLAHRCGNCHDDLFRQFGLSMHGALSNLGYGPGAKCSDCHGFHDILPIDDPRSRLAKGEPRMATCRKCHENAVPNFCDFQPHADFTDEVNYPLLHFVHLAMELLIYSVFAFFGAHSVLWLLRSWLHVMIHGRPRRLVPGETAYVRFAPSQRLLHAIVVVSFLGLALTGLPLKYSDQPWAEKLAYTLGGFDSTGLWHHICGVITVLYFVSHLGWLTRRLWVQSRQGANPVSLVLGPDSPVPNPRDFADMFRMFRWFFFLGRKPGFDRWTYWEKFDYWAVFWGVGIIGTSGLILWFPNFFCTLLPGEALNVAKIVHSEEALLATSFIFAIHFFGTHLRPEKFPIDMAVLAGLVTEEELREERPDFMRRMEESGQLESLQTEVPSAGQLRTIALIGFVALAVGIALLAGILTAIFNT